MYEFLDRLINVAMPRIRDFRGVSARSFDGRGNYSFGRQGTDHLPEIAYDKIRRDPRHGHHESPRTARDDREGRSAARILQLPVSEIGQAQWRRPA